MLGDLSIEEFVMGENFHEGGTGLFSIFLKNNEKNIKSFSTESKKEH